MSDPRVEPHQPERDRAALRGLAAWSSRFSPRVAADEDGLLIDVSGCEAVFKGETRLLARANEEYGALGFEAVAAIAPTFGCAWAVARFGRGGIVAEGAVRAALEDVPLAGLRIGSEAVQALEEVGIERIGQVLDLPRSLLPARFGDELLMRLDQAMGRAFEIIDPVRASPPPVVSQTFDGPTTQWEAVAGCTRALVERLCGMLQQGESGARRVDVTLVRSDLPPAVVTVMLSRPCRDPRHLWSLLVPRLERVSLGREWGGVDEVRVAALCVRPLPHEQAEHWRRRDVDQERELAGFLDTVRNRLGADRALHPVSRETHIPERAAALSPEPRGSAIVAWGDRPTVLLTRPLPAEVVLLAPDGPMLRVRTRAGEHAIATTIGPEHIDSEWWKGRCADRAYFKVQDEHGVWQWLYREIQTGRWFVHGFWA